MVEEEIILHNHPVFGETQLPQYVFFKTSCALRRELKKYSHKDTMEQVSRNIPVCVKKGLHTDIQAYGRTDG